MRRATGTTSSSAAGTATARDLIDELRGDDYKLKVVVLADADKNPAGDGVYFVRGDATNAEDLDAGRHRRGVGGAGLPGRRAPTTPTCTRS